MPDRKLVRHFVLDDILPLTRVWPLSWLKDGAEKKKKTALELTRLGGLFAINQYEQISCGNIF